MANKPLKKPHTSSKVAKVFTEYLEASDKTQTEISAKMGFDRPNMITMVKSGLSRLAYKRVLPFCEETGGDPERLFLTMIEEYDPDMLDVIAEIKGAAVTETDKAILKAVRAARKEAETALQAKMKEAEVTAADKSRIRDVRLQFDRSPESLAKLADWMTKHMFKKVD